MTGELYKGVKGNSGLKMGKDFLKRALISPRSYRKWFKWKESRMKARKKDEKGQLAP